MVSERPDSRRCAAGWFTLFVVLMCCLCLVTTVAATAGAEETRDTKGGKTLGDGYDPEEMRELRKNLEELQEDVQAILKRVQHSEELYVEANNTMTWLEWLLGAETEEPAPEAPMGPSEACRNFYECFGACTVMALRMAKLVWLSFMTPLLGEKAEWVRAVVSTYLPMNNFIEVIRSLCLLSMCYRILRAITPDPVFELLIRMILSPFTLTRVIVWSIVDVLGSVCFKEAWDNLKEYWEKENPNADEDTTDTRGRREPNRTPRCEGQAKTDEGASFKDFCPSKSIVRSKKDLTNLMEDVKFQIGDDFARIHALLRSLDSTDAATARFAAFVRKECAKITKTETLPQSSKRARSCGIKVKDMWGKVATRAHEYFTATGGDIFASLRELQGLRKEAGEDLSQYIARFTSTWANLEPPVPESKAIEVILPVLPRDFAKLMTTLQNLLLESDRWPNMEQDVRNFISRCPNCAFNGEEQRRDAPSTEISRRIGERVAMDYCGPFFDGSHILVIVDDATKWIEAVRTPGTGAVHAMRALDLWQEKHGQIELLCTDNASAWNSDKFRQWATSRGVEARRSPSYHHQANGLAERAIKTLCERIRRFLNGSPRAWPQAIQEAVDAINTSWNSVTKTTPLSLMMGIGRNGVMLEEEVIRKVWEEAWKSSQLAKTYEHGRFRWKHPRLSKPLLRGDRVLLKNHHQMRHQLRKLGPKWIGPFVVEEQRSSSTWIIREQRNAPPFLVHSSQIKPYVT